MKTFTSSILAFAALASQAEAFWGKSHMLLARASQDMLETNYPDVFAAILSELEVLELSNPEICQEDKHPFTECAPFADHIKGMGYAFQSDWHFINLPYLDEPGTTLADFSFTQPDMDVVGALTDFHKFMKGEISGSESAYTNEVVAKFSDETQQRSFILRMLVHYVGDIHQPEHTTALVDSKYPTGDRGGNSETVPSVQGASNLHAIWDSAIYAFPGKPKPPLNDDDWDWYTSEAATLASTYPISSSDIKSGQFSDWAEEGRTIAETYVYPAFVDGEDPDQDYIDAALPIIEEHMMLGAHRLAALMVDIYGSSERAANFIMQ